MPDHQLENKRSAHKKLLYFFCVLFIFVLAGFIRWHNLNNYTTVWADDGGAHLKYVDVLLQEHRFPTLQETYVAWHEPIYYFMAAVWSYGGKAIGIDSLKWLEALNILLYGFFLVIIWFFFYENSKKNKWIALLALYLFSILFVGVKLSAYVNNELLNQLLLVLLLLLFSKWSLLAETKEKEVLWWALLLAVATLVKITALIVLLSVIIIWLIKWVVTKKSYFLKYILLVFLVVSIVNAPWVIYKQKNYRGYFSINIYDAKPHQNILSSEGWSYIKTLNARIFVDYPYWFSAPDSYLSILVSDTFGDYYNLFNDYVRMEELPADRKILVGNGRYTTPYLWRSMLRVNRLGALIAVFWSLGFLAWIMQQVRSKRINGYDLFLLIALTGGWLALLYQNLRLPYLEAGVLKAHFIYFTYPIFTLFAYQGWWEVLKNKVWWSLISFVPLIVYLFLAANILLVNSRI